METTLVLNLSIDKDTYHEGEAITATLHLENASTQEVVIKKRLAVNAVFAPAAYRDVAFIVADADGNRKDFRARVNLGAPKPNDFGLLKPGDSIQQIYTITRYYDVTKPGAYTIKAFYYNESSLDDKAVWQGEISSNTIKLNIDNK